MAPKGVKAAGVPVPAQWPVADASEAVGQAEAMAEAEASEAEAEPVHMKKEQAAAPTHHPPPSSL